MISPMEKGRYRSLIRKKIKKIPRLQFRDFEKKSNRRPQGLQLRRNVSRRASGWGGIVGRRRRVVSGRRILTLGSEGAWCREGVSSHSYSSTSSVVLISITPPAIAMRTPPLVPGLMYWSLLIIPAPLRPDLRGMLRHLRGTCWMEIPWQPSCFYRMMMMSFICSSRGEGRRGWIMNSLGGFKGR